MDESYMMLHEKQIKAITNALTNEDLNRDE
jgi:hypothetical protein